MGCGILFPRDYPAGSADSDGTHDLSPDAAGDDDDADAALDADYLELEQMPSSESEDEEWWEKPSADNGTEVQVSKSCRQRHTPSAGFQDGCPSDCSVPKAHDKCSCLFHCFLRVTGVLHAEREDDRAAGDPHPPRRLLPDHRHAQLRREGQGRPAPAHRVDRTCAHSQTAPP